MNGPILFVRTGALGDFILTLPVLEGLLLLGEPVDVAIPSRFRPLLPPGIRRIFDSGASEVSWIYEEKNPFAYRSAVAFSPLTVDALTAAGIQVFSASPLPSGPAAQHFASALPFPVSTRPRLRIPRMADPDGPLVISPGSGGISKRWPLEKWAEVAENLGEPVQWVAGPQEEGESWPVPPLRLGLWETAELAARCRGWMGPDAGPTHLAAAAGAPVLAIFRTTDPAIWAPEGADVLVEPSVAAVLQWANYRRR